ncbi:MAG TPA: hydrolase 2, exosortase A system-associated [Stellaceae bacterium]|nr:hydrolase 2, exosortase A system-associated [Stellaceae bacterium]
MKPVFIDSAAGRIFAIYHPARGVSHGKTIIYLPPFTEEMNRSRRVAALQAREFTRLGFAVLLLDPFGTGDSAGEFRDARWDIWLDDVSAAADWLAKQGLTPSILWGLRVGSLLAAAAASRESGRFERLLLWQPVTDGKSMLTQFLRIRIASSLQESGAREKTEGLRAELEAGRSVHVAGYELSPSLAAAIGMQRLENYPPPSDMRIDWLEIAPGESDVLSPTAQRISADWRSKGAAVNALKVTDDAFWNLQETTLAPHLVAATGRLFQ